MDRQSPILLKCHCVLKTGATDIFCTFKRENVFILQLHTRKAGVLSLLGLLQPGSLWRSAAGRSLCRNVVFFSVLSHFLVLAAPHRSPSVCFHSLPLALVFNWKSSLELFNVRTSSFYSADQSLLITVCSDLLHSRYLS